MPVEIVTASAQMRRAVEVAERVATAPQTSTVLVIGETGTGKDLVARHIHERSGAIGAFVTIDCAALPETLVESELFGHVRGAFTGATESRAGRLEAARGGTLVLDEVAALSLSAQAKLLRVLEERRFTRLGPACLQFAARSACGRCRTCASCGTISVSRRAAAPGSTMSIYTREKGGTPDGGNGYSRPYRYNRY